MDANNHVFSFPPNGNNVLLTLKRRPKNGKHGKARSRDPFCRSREKYAVLNLY